MLSPPPSEVTLAALLQRRLRARRIVAMLVNGKTRKQIAFTLGLSPHTVDWHLRRLYRELRIHNAVQLAAMWEQLDPQTREETFSGNC